MLTQEFGWRAIFWINVPLTIVAAVLGAATIRESVDRSAPRRLDVVGLATITTGIGLITLTFDRAPDWGWTAAPTIALFVGAFAVLAVFVRVETRIAQPLVDLSLIRNSTFAVLVLAGTVANIAYAVTIFASTLYLQQVRELDPLAAGIVFLGPSIGAALGGPLSGRLATRIAPTTVMAVGCILGGGALAWLSRAHAWPNYVPALTLCGFALGFVYAFTTVATQSAVSKDRAGEAAGITLTTLVTMAGAGIALTSSTLESLGAGGVDLDTAIDRVLVTLALALVVSGLAVAVRSQGKLLFRSPRADGIH